MRVVDDMLQMVCRVAGCNGAFPSLACAVAFFTATSPTSLTMLVVQRG